LIVDLCLAKDVGREEEEGKFPFKLVQDSQDRMRHACNACTPLGLILSSDRSDGTKDKRKKRSSKEFEKPRYLR